MKAFYCTAMITAFLLIFSNGIQAQISSTTENSSKFNPDRPLFFTPKSHDPNFLKSGKSPKNHFTKENRSGSILSTPPWGREIHYRENWKSLIPMPRRFVKNLMFYVFWIWTGIHCIIITWVKSMNPPAKGHSHL